MRRAMSVTRINKLRTVWMLRERDTREDASRYLSARM